MHRIIIHIAGLTGKISVLDASVSRVGAIVHNISFKMHTHGGIFLICILHVPISWIKFIKIDNVRKLRID